MAIIYWKNNQTGETGNGQAIDLEDARAMVAYANEAWPHIDHWLVEQN